MKKKKFTEPELQVVEIEQTDIICTSTQTDAFGILSGTGYEETTW